MEIERASLEHAMLQMIDYYGGLTNVQIQQLLLEEGVEDETGLEKIDDVLANLSEHGWIGQARDNAW